MPGTALKVPQRPASSLWLAPAIAAGLVLITLATFYGLHRCEFVNLDDFDYVVNNPHVNKGLSWPVFTWAFTHAYSCNWHPLTWLSHALDCQLFGLNPAGHHITNLLLHALSTAVLFFALRRMTGAVWRSAVVAALFAVHPLHVESVAWISERKDVLSGLFFMLTLYAYTRYAEVRKLGTASCGFRATHDRQPLQRFNTSTLQSSWYSASLVLFAFGLMSKPMLVTLPFVLLLLDYWPLRQLVFKSEAPTIKELVLEKLPFFALAAASSLITVLSQRASQVTLSSVPMDDRWGNAVLSFVAYLRQTFRPAGLAAYYPYPKQVPIAEAVLASALLLGLAGIAWSLRKSRPFLVTGWLWFLGMLVPVIGVIQVGAQAHADRYTYLPSIGLFIALIWTAASVVSSRHRYALVLAGCGALGGLACVAHLQSSYWINSASLFEHADSVVADNYFAMTQVAMTDLKSGRVDAALPKLTRALEIEPSYPVANHQMAVALFKQGKGAAAIPYLRRAEAQAELAASTHLLFALIYIQVGNLDEARTHLDRAEAERPGEPDVAVVRASLLTHEGNLEAAEQIYREILSLHPEHIQAQAEFANFLLNQNRPIPAEPLFATAVKQQPQDVGLRIGFALALSMQGKLSQAMEQMERARKLAPGDPLVSFQSAEIFNRAQKTREAISCYEQALEQNPSFAGAMNNLAWILATHTDDHVRNGRRAVELAQKACELTQWRMPVLMGTLAAAYAEAGRFEDAIKTAERARDKAKSVHQDDVAERNEELIKLYRSGKPYRQ